MARQRLLELSEERLLVVALSLHARRVLEPELTALVRGDGKTVERLSAPVGEATEVEEALAKGEARLQGVP